MVEEKVVVRERHVSCDGGNGPLGHPKVYMYISDEENEAICPYCGKVFLYEKEEAQ